MNRYIVTGGAGFIGSALVRALLADGREVHVVDNLSSGNLDNLQEVASRVTFHKADICRYEQIVAYYCRRSSRLPFGCDSFGAQVH